MSKHSIRIATWNIASNKNYEAIAARIAALDIDTCALQEVSLDPAADLPAMFDRGHGDPTRYCRYFSPALPPEGLGGGRYAHYGLCMLTRTPPSQMAAFHLGPGHRDSIRDYESEPRILQVVALPLREPIIIANTHLAATDDWSESAVRRSQAGKIASILRPLATRGPLILCGDFNAEPTSPDLAEIREVLPYIYASQQGTYTGEPDRPPIDFFCSSIAIDVTISVFPADGLSDHDLVVATLGGLGIRT